MRTPPAPKEISSKEAKGLWKSVLANYEIDQAGIEVLRVAVVSLDNFLRYQAMMQKFGPVFKSKSGQIKKNPISELLKVERVGFLQAMRDLGLEGDTEVRRQGRPTSYGI